MKVELTIEVMANINKAEELERVVTAVLLKHCPQVVAVLEITAGELV